MDEVWRRVYVYDWSNRRVTQVDITTDIYEQAIEYQELLQSTVGTSEDWDGTVQCELPVASEYNYERSLSMPKYLRVYPEKFEIGYWSPDGWMSDSLETYGGVCFERRLADIHIGEFHREVEVSIADVLRQEDQEPFNLFIEAMKSEFDS